MNIFKSSALLIGGALVGAAVALLFTTEKGAQVRQQMGEMADEAKKHAQDYCEQAKKRAQDYCEQVKNQIQEAVEEV